MYKAHDMVIEYAIQVKNRWQIVQSCDPCCLALRKPNVVIIVMQKLSKMFSPHPHDSVVIIVGKCTYPEKIRCTHPKKHQIFYEPGSCLTTQNFSLKNQNFNCPLHFRNSKQSGILMCKHFSCIKWNQTTVISTSHKVKLQPST